MIGFKQTRLETFTFLTNGNARCNSALIAVLRGEEILPRVIIGFQDRCIKPLCHPSGSSNANNATPVRIGKSSRVSCAMSPDPVFFGRGG
jgi:hypothetical protein